MSHMITMHLDEQGNICYSDYGGLAERLSALEVYINRNPSFTTDKVVSEAHQLCAQFDRNSLETPSSVDKNAQDTVRKIRSHLNAFAIRRATEFLM